MLAKRAREMAQEWTDKNAQQIPGCLGVVLHGSINWMDDEEVLAASSDLDLLLVMEPGISLPHRQKFRYRRLMLELSPIPLSDLQPPDTVLRTHYLAGSFFGETVLWDASGYLQELQNIVTVHYPERRWVEQRCQSVTAKIRAGFPADPQWPLHRILTAWMFAAGLCSHVILVAGLGNPTVRRRLAASQLLLQRLDRLDIQEELLGLFHAGELTPTQIAQHTKNLSRLFAEAIPLVHDGYPFAADITPSGRDIAITGTQEMVQQGLHRETVFWLGASLARCLQVVTEQGTLPQRQQGVALANDFLSDLGVNTESALRQAHTSVLEALPRIEQHGQWIMDHHPGIFCQ